jgi:hypothetical protein
MYTMLTSRRFSPYIFSLVRRSVSKCRIWMIHPHHCSFCCPIRLYLLQHSEICQCHPTVTTASRASSFDVLASSSVVFILLSLFARKTKVEEDPLCPLQPFKLYSASPSDRLAKPRYRPSCKSFKPLIARFIVLSAPSSLFFGLGFSDSP